MKHTLGLALLLWLFAATPLKADSELENGGSTILHAVSTFVMTDSKVETLVIIASEKEIVAATQQIHTSKEPVYFAIEGHEDDNMRLEPASDLRLIGKFVKSGQRVMIVTQAYADEHELAPDPGIYDI